MVSTVVEVALRGVGSTGKVTYKIFQKVEILEWSKKKVKILRIKSDKASTYSTNAFSKCDVLQQIIALMCVFSLMKNVLHLCHQAHLPPGRDCPSVYQVTYCHKQVYITYCRSHRLASDYRFQLAPKLSILLGRNAEHTANRNAKQD